MGIFPFILLLFRKFIVVRGDFPSMQERAEILSNPSKAFPSLITANLNPHPCPVKEDPSITKSTRPSQKANSQSR